MWPSLDPGCITKPYGSKYLLRKCLGYDLGECLVPSQEVFGSIGRIYIYIYICIHLPKSRFMWYMYILIYIRCIICIYIYILDIIKTYPTKYHIWLVIFTSLHFHSFSTLRNVVIPGAQKTQGFHHGNGLAAMVWRVLPRLGALWHWWMLTQLFGLGNEPSR